jgi:hypothetical protein
MFGYLAKLIARVLNTQKHVVDQVCKSTLAKHVLTLKIFKVP